MHSSVDNILHLAFCSLNAFPAYLEVKLTDSIWCVKHCFLTIDSDLLHILNVSKDRNIN